MMLRIASSRSGLPSVAGRRWFSGSRAVWCGAGDAGSPAEDAVLCSVDTEGFATITLNRPALFNAFSDHVIARFASVFDALKEQKGNLRWS